VEKKTNILDLDRWIRGIFMILFGFLSFFSRLILIVIGALQFILLIFTGSLNENLKNAGEAISIWTYHAFLFITYNKDEKPFPFSDWPKSQASEGKVNETSTLNEGDDIPSFVNKKE
jgi:hypothetical protein|tara:strand:- start:626 stop:976 length:351 start_codon:yes stop_codon:yes gene_type:complete